MYPGASDFPVAVDYEDIAEEPERRRFPYETFESLESHGGPRYAGLDGCRMARADFGNGVRAITSVSQRAGAASLFIFQSR